MKHYPRRHRHLPCDVWEGIKNLSLRFTEKFRDFVKKEFKTDLNTLFIDEKSEEKKINQLDKWWNSYKKQER